jgi:energy-coupling factor transporter transmembrane protein EcfT
MKRSFLMIGIIFIITLAVIFGFRASADAMAVVIGVLLGVVASIPATLLLVYGLTRQPNRLDRTTQAMPPQPPVFVINTSDKPQPYSPPLLPAPYLPAENGRKWTVIGDTETEL